VKVIYSTNASEDKAFWDKTNPKLAKRIEKLIADIKLHPFTGLGKPEPLKFQMSGYWSRRIDNEHRLIYKIANKIIYIAQCRYHY
jgi:toxin YoeB